MNKMTELFNTLKDNLTFVIGCALIAAALIGAAWLCEHIFHKNIRRVGAAKRCAYIGVFSAISAVLMLFELPVFFAPGFYKIDLSELPVLLCSFTLGPVAGVIAEALKVVIKIFIKGTTTAFVGDFANFMVGSMLILPAAAVYQAMGRSRKAAIIGLIAGTLAMTTFGTFFNAIYLLPKFAALYGMPMEAIIAMGSDVNPAITDVTTLVMFAVAPLNLIKGAAVSVITMLLYRHLERLLHVK